LRRGGGADGHRRRQHSRSELHGLHTSPPFGLGDMPASDTFFLKRMPS
jgi:hypothetical protein